MTWVSLGVWGLGLLTYVSANRFNRFADFNGYHVDSRLCSAVNPFSTTPGMLFEWVDGRPPCRHVLALSLAKTNFVVPHHHDTISAAGTRA